MRHNMFFRIMLEYDSVVNEMVDLLPERLFEDKNSTFLDPAFGGGQMLQAIAKRLHKYGHSIENIKSRLHGYEDNLIYINHAKNKITHKIANLNIVKYQDFLDRGHMKKFDVVIGNPPFSLAGNKKGKKGRARNLYPDFYEKAVRIANTVAMIVPNTEKQHITFNTFIRKHTNDIIRIPDGTFPINISTWILIKNGSKNNVDHINWMDLQKLPKQKVRWGKGKINVTNDKNLLVNNSSGVYTVIHKINRSGMIVTKTSERVDQRKLFPHDGYAVIMPQQIQTTGWSATEIVKCTGKEAATNGVNIAFVDSYEEAEYLIGYMKNREFIDQALNNCGGMNNMTLGAMQRIDMKEYKFVFAS